MVLRRLVANPSLMECEENSVRTLLEEFVDKTPLEEWRSVFEILLTLTMLETYT